MLRLTHFSLIKINIYKADESGDWLIYRDIYYLIINVIFMHVNNKNSLLKLYEWLQEILACQFFRLANLALAIKPT